MYKVILDSKVEITKFCDLYLEKLTASGIPQF